MYILGGFLALGAFLDSVSNAISLLTPFVAGTWDSLHCAGMVVWYTSSCPGITSRGSLACTALPVKKPGIQPTAIAVGMVLLLWMPYLSCRRLIKE